MNTIFNLSVETLSHYKECFDRNNSPKDIANLQWQFFENGSKNFVDIEFDEHNKKVTAIYATFGVQFKIDSDVYLGSQSLDTITDIDYRGKGLFIKLAKDVYEKATNDGVALVYGFPNGNSIHGFKTKLGWEVLDPVPFLIKPLQSSYFTSRISFLKSLPNINLSFSNFKKSKQFIIVEQLSFPESVNQIWSNFSKNIKVVVQRDKKYLDWRYVSKPSENYKIAHCYDHKNTYLGYVVYAVKGKHGGKIAYIMELVYDLEVPKSGDALLKYAVHEIKNEKADCILSWCFAHSPNFSNFKKAFFLTMPEKFRPIELHFGARCFNDSLKDVINTRANWYLSYSDSDTV
jgi:hypothetical protein